MSENEEKRCQRSLTVTIRADAGTPRGELIDYVRQHPSRNEHLVEDLLSGAFMPFVLGDPKNAKDSKRVQDDILHYFGKLLGYVEAVAQRYGLKNERLLQSANSLGVLKFSDDVREKKEVKSKRAKEYEQFTDEMKSLGL